jgi:hypothetical protein
MTTRVAHQRARSAGRSCSAGSRHRRGLTCASPASRRQRCIQLHRRRQFSNRACAQVATDTVTVRKVAARRRARWSLRVRAAAGSQQGAFLGPLLRARALAGGVA